MASFELRKVQHEFGKTVVNALVPNEKEVQAWYTSQRQQAEFLFPFWAKTWPAAIGLCTFLAQNTYLLKNKKVLELAGGLGLPSLLAARWATNVSCTDISIEPTQIVQRAAVRNSLDNLKAFTLDWNNLPPIQTEILLLSDVNYDPLAFEALYIVLTKFLNEGTTVVISTPQRIMAKPFINRLLPFCTHQEVITVNDQTAATDISIFVLRIIGRL